MKERVRIVTRGNHSIVVKDNKKKYELMMFHEFPIPSDRGPRSVRQARRAPEMVHKCPPKDQGNCWKYGVSRHGECHVPTPYEHIVHVGFLDYFQGNEENHRRSHVFIRFLLRYLRVMRTLMNHW